MKRSGETFEDYKKRMRKESVPRWGLLWHSRNRTDGVSEHLIYENRMPVMFLTRKAAREWANDHYGYIKARVDLWIEPHGWRMPRPVRVKVIVCR